MKMKSKAITENISRFCKSIDIDYQVDFVKEYAQIGDDPLYGGKHCGSDAEHEGARFIASKLEEMGIKAELIPCDTTRYQFNGAELTVNGEEKVIHPYGYVSPGTTDEGISAPLIDIGKSTKEVYEALGKSPEGKIGLMAAMGALEGDDLAGQIEEAILRGVAAIVIYAVEDVLDEDTIRVQTPLISSPVPIVGISGRDASYLKGLLKSGKEVDVTLKVDADYIPDGGVTYNVVGEIPGLTDEKIIYTAHLDHFFRCIQDNISSCSTLLGLAKAFKDSGYRPNRSIMFAFHGSHETGGSETRYPYIVGSYRLTHEGKPEWMGKAVADINFEYTALRQKVLNAGVFPGADVNLRKYLEYAPELKGGFDRITEEIDCSGYYMMSWCDAIAYHTAGIPAYSNDIISEQMAGDSPYIGRDHSNADDMAVFDRKTLEDNARFYGGLGIYIDSLPYLEMDFTSMAKQVEIETKADILKSAGIDTSGLMRILDMIKEYGDGINDAAQRRNVEYLQAAENPMDEKTRADYFTEARSFNEEMLSLYKVFADDIYMISAMDFLCLGSSKHTGNIEKLQETIDYINAGKLEEAMTEALAYVDLCMASYYFSEEIAERMKRRICGDEYAGKRTWARGRELSCETYYELVETMRRKTSCLMAPHGIGDYIKVAKALITPKSFLPKLLADVIEMLEAAIENERKKIPEIFSAEEAALRGVEKRLERIDTAMKI